MKLKTTHTLSAIKTLAWVIEHNKSQDIEDEKAKKAFKIIDDLIY